MRIPLVVLCVLLVSSLGPAGEPGKDEPAAKPEAESSPVTPAAPPPSSPSVSTSPPAAPAPAEPAAPAPAEPAAPAPAEPAAPAPSRPRVPAPKPPAVREPFLDPRTGIVFPVALGPMTLQWTRNDNRPAFGPSVGYEVRDPVEVQVIIEIYDLGIKGIGHGAGSQAVKAHFEKVKADFLAREGVGDLRDIKPQPQKPVSLMVGGKPLPMLAATYEFIYSAGPNNVRPEREAVRHLLVTGYKGRFLCVKVDYPNISKDAKVKSAKIVEAFLVAFGGVLK